MAFTGPGADATTTTTSWARRLRWTGMGTQRGLSRTPSAMSQSGFIFARGETRETVLRGVDSKLLDFGTDNSYLRPYTLYGGGVYMEGFKLNWKYHCGKCGYSICAYFQTYFAIIVRVEQTGCLHIWRGLSLGLRDLVSCVPGQVGHLFCTIFDAIQQKLCQISNHSTVPIRGTGKILSLRTYKQVSGHKWHRPEHHPDFTGTVKSSIQTSPVLSSIQTVAYRPATPRTPACWQPSGTCANADVGVHCYGCGMDNNHMVVVPVYCQSCAPSAFVPAGTHILSVNASDPRCDGR